MDTIINRLREQIRQTETGNRLDNGGVVKNACAAIDRLLPGHGYPRGTLVQWITGGGQGADYLSLRVAQQACLDGGALVIIDPLSQFFPPAAAAIGINLEHLIVLRSGHENVPRDLHTHSISHAPAISHSAPRVADENDLLWAIDQALRCPAVAAVWGPIAEIDERWFRRFQLAAESSGCLGLFLQSPAAAKRPSWAEVQWLVGMGQPTASSVAQPTQTVQLQLTRCRGTQTGKSIELTINHITGNVQPTRRAHEPPTSQPAAVPKPASVNAVPATTLAPSSAHRLPVAAELVHPADGRRRA